MNKKNYKNTLFMYTTHFDMRANLPQKEEYFRKHWLDNNLYQKILNQNKSSQKVFVLHDGPPYANGNLHIGHALNKILKDIIVRYKNFCGIYSPFLPGWDCHGLPIEHKMLKNLQKQHTDLNVLELRKKSAAYALEQIEVQKNQFSSFLLLSDFKEKYLTLTPDYEAKQLEVFQTMFEKGLVFQDLKPVFWSCSSLSALAEGEVEYRDKKSYSAYVLCPITQGNNLISKGTFALIWTTQPWTLLANAAIAIHPEATYVLVEFKGLKLFFAKQQISRISKYLEEFLGAGNLKILVEFQGKEVQNIFYERPIIGQEKKLVISEHVEINSGSGLVHIAPAFGLEDFELFKRFDLEFIMHVEDDGTINKLGGQFENQKYWEADKNIIALLKKQQLLLHVNPNFTHSYPHDWRTYLPVIYRATTQWFVSISKIKNDILEAVKSVTFKHEWERERLYNMLSARDSWTISRQRSWGVPIPIFYDQEKKVINNSEIFEYVIMKVRQLGSDCWFELEADELLPEKYRGNNYRKELDIMDVWYDSGSSFYCVNVSNLAPPFDLYFEGSDQFRGWFNSSMINGVIKMQTSPYKMLISHGHVVDEKGNKMSKSKGNVVDPLEIVQKHGAEILRLWIASNDYNSNVSFSWETLKQVEQNYRKIRNTIRFLLSNLNSQIQEEVVLEGIHALMEERFNNLIFEVKNLYENFEFHLALKTINHFISELSNYYFSLSKDIIYIKPASDLEKKQVLYNFQNFCENFLKLLAPILPVTTEEAYSFFVKKDKKSSIHLESFPTVSQPTKTLENLWMEFFELKNQVFREIELCISRGEVKRGAEVRVILPLVSDFLQKQNLKQLLMVAEVDFGLKLQVKKLENAYKCLRCWNFFASSFDLEKELCFGCRNLVGDLGKTL